jgi:hypothetical protein
LAKSDARYIDSQDSNGRFHSHPDKFSFFIHSVSHPTAATHAPHSNAAVFRVTPIQKHVRPTYFDIPRLTKKRFTAAGIFNIRIEEGISLPILLYFTSKCHP